MPIAIEVVRRLDALFEIERYRMLRHKILMQYREQAIQQSLRRIDLLEIPPEADGLVRQQIRRNAWCWRS